MRAGLEEMHDKIDMAIVTDVVSTTSTPLSSPKPNLRTSFNNLSTSTIPSILSRSVSRRKSSSSLTISNPGGAAPLSISLLSVEGVLAELTAIDSTTYASWVDGLALLRPDGVISTKESEDMVQLLVEFSIKIKLLGGELLDSQNENGTENGDSVEPTKATGPYYTQ